jgi:glycogen(starch) synthase
VLREQAARRGVAELVEFSGRVPADEAARLLAGCDVYVQLSRNEGSPLSLNDALVLGKPVIASDRVGTVSSPEIARLRHVMVVPCDVEAAARAITSALSNGAQLVAAARAARPELADLLSWEEAARRHLQLYESLVPETTRVRSRSPLA